MRVIQRAPNPLKQLTIAFKLDTVATYMNISSKYYGGCDSFLDLLYFMTWEVAM